MIHFSAEGGFTGQMRSLTVDGTRATVEVNGAVSEGSLDADVVDGIVAQLDASGLFDEDHTFDPPAGADLQRYEIRYRDATVVAHDLAVPAELIGAITSLEEAIRQLTT